MFKGLASDLSGTSDICHPVRDLQKCNANAYVLTNETIMFSLQSAKEEYTFTNHALIVLSGASGTTTRRLVSRYDYKTNTIEHVRYETAGRVDRDVEIKFRVGGEDISIDVARAEEATAQMYYKVLVHLSRAQSSNAKSWKFAQTAMAHSAESMRGATAPEGRTLVNQADEALGWMETQYERFNPRCYRDVIDGAFRDIDVTAKMQLQ